MATKRAENGHGYAAGTDHEEDAHQVGGIVANDVFGQEENHQIKYKTLSWPLVSILMIAEIVSNGMLSLPSSLATIGIVPGLIVIIFLGIFATYTSYILVNFKLRHPDVHNMGDAGYILAGRVGKEVLGAGTVIFAVFATGGQLLAGQIAITSLSHGKVCPTLGAGIFAVVTLVGSFPRTLERLGWLSVPSVVCIAVAGVVGMVGAGLKPVDGRRVEVVEHPGFYVGFSSVTNPVFAYAGHFMFFILMSEMKTPTDAMKAAYTLQSFATSYYAIFAAITYVYIGSTVASPSFSSLSPAYQKAAYAVAIPNFLIAGCLYAHTAAKLVFVRLFRGSVHLHEHTMLGWSSWIALVMVMNIAAFVLAVGVPIFNYLIGLAASLFAAWYTYGVAGCFWLHDTYYDHGGLAGWQRRPVQTGLAIGTFFAGAFICVAGLYVNIKGIVEAYQSGAVAKPFSC